MHWLQFAISVAAAYAFDRWQALDPLPTWQSWTLGVLIIGVGSAWLFTVIVTRLADAVRSARLRRR